MLPTKFFRRELPFLCLVLLFASSALAAKRMPDDLFSVTFPTEKEGWACGRWGNIIHTADGGATWEFQESGTDYTLMSVAFADTKNGWAVGDGGTIVHTSDGGVTWQKQESPVPYYHMGVFFIDPQTGWICSERTHILHTTDGGATWTVQFTDVDYILKAISFCDRLNGWAVGEYGYIYHTQDAGTTWEHQAGYFEVSYETGIPEGGQMLFDVLALGPSTAWGVGIDGYVIRTSDGGTTWEELDTKGPKTHLFRVRADGKDRIMICGRGAFLESPDGGTTWEQASFEPDIEYGWLYGMAHRGDSDFVTVGWAGAVYRNTSEMWQQAEYAE